MGKDNKKTNSFETAIKSHLDEVAKTDETFAKNYAKANKSIEECCRYIIGEARKQSQNGVAAISDEEVYGMAIHYYDEDDIKVGPVSSKVEVTQTGDEKPKKQRKPKKQKTEAAETVPTADSDNGMDGYELEIPLF